MSLNLLSDKLISEFPIDESSKHSITFPIETPDGGKINVKYTHAHDVKAIALLCSGSGVISENGDVSSPFVGKPHGSEAPLNDQLALALREIGISTLSYSKRGFLDPSQVSDYQLENTISDGEFIIRESFKSFPKTKRMILGFSEGALIAAALSRSNHFDVAVLLAPPTKSLEDILQHQAIDWPCSLLEEWTGKKANQIYFEDLSVHKIETLPFTELKSSDFPKDKSAQDYYQEGLNQLVETLENSEYQNWMKSMRDFDVENCWKHLPKRTYIFQALKDSQIDPNWMKSHELLSHSAYKYKEYDGLGHCFSSFHDPLGYQKSSGPFEDEVILDIKESLSRELSIGLIQ